MPWGERVRQVVDALSYFGGLFAMVGIIGYGIATWVDKGLKRDEERFEDYERGE